MTTLMNQLQARIETAVNKTGTYNEALQNLANLYGVPQGETGSRLIPVVQVFDPTINNATAAQNYLLYNSTIVSGGVPSLGLDFTSASLDPRVTFTRASTATRVNAAGLIESVAINGPRFDYDPVTLSPKGLLIEEQRTNLLTYSEDFSNAVWIKTLASITANAAVAPDGTLTADKLISTSASGFHSAYQNFGPKTASAAYTFSFYAKAGEIGYCVPNFNSGLTGTQLACTINLSTGAATGVSAGLTVSTTSVGNGWWRISISAIGDATTNSFASTINATNGSGSTGPFTGNDVDGIFIWGAQLEAGAFATSYIPTVAAQVTRSADNASMVGDNFANWYNASEQTWFVEYAHLAVGSNGRRVLSIGGDGADLVDVLYGVSSTADGTYMVSGGVPGSINASVINPRPTTPTKVALAFKVNDYQSAYSGILSASDTSFAMPVGINRLGIGRNNTTAADFLCGHIRRIMYYNTRLTNAQLQALTS